MRVHTHLLVPACSGAIVRNVSHTLTSSHTRDSMGTHLPEADWRICTHSHPHIHTCARTYARAGLLRCNCDKGFMCALDDQSEDGARLSYANDSAPVPKGFSCPTGTQFKVPFDYG
jgi:hypothetical protein